MPVSDAVYCANATACRCNLVVAFTVYVLDEPSIFTRVHFFPFLFKWRPAITSVSVPTCKL